MLDDGGKALPCRLAMLDSRVDAHKRKDLDISRLLFDNGSKYGFPVEEGLLGQITLDKRFDTHVRLVELSEECESGVDTIE